MSSLHQATALAVLLATSMACSQAEDLRDSTGVSEVSDVSADTETETPEVGEPIATAGSGSEGASDPTFPVAAARPDDPDVWPGDPLPAGAVLHETPTGLRFGVLSVGEGERPSGLFDTVTVHYSGYFTDGGSFDASVGGPPFTTPLTQVVAGWGEGVPLMRTGARYKFVLPPDLAYGADGRPGIPGNATLVFDIELLSVDQRVAIPAFVLPTAAECTVTETGLMHQVLEAGDGEPIAFTDPVKLAYTCWTADGRTLDTSLVRGGPLAMTPEQITLKGLKEGLQRMRGGGRARFVIPSDLAYGAAGMGRRVPPNTDLVYEVEVVEHLRPLPVPDFFKPEAADLTVTDSGLGYLVLETGEGAGPTATSTVRAHYAGWFDHGGLFDSSYQRGEPYEFLATQVIPGWTEGLQLMSPGAVYVFVIPPDLAYGPGGRPGIPPNSTLVFRVELVDFTD